MQFQEVSQHWSWHCQRAPPPLRYSGPISTRHSPSTALLSLQPLITPQGKAVLQNLNCSHYHLRDCPVLAAFPNIRANAGLYLVPSISQSSWLFLGTLDCLATHHSVTVVLHPGNLSLRNITTGQVRAAVHPEAPGICHHHVQSTEGLHAMYDPTRPDHGGAGWWDRRLTQHGGTRVWQEHMAFLW